MRADGGDLMNPWEPFETERLGERRRFGDAVRGIEGIRGDDGDLTIAFEHVLYLAILWRHCLGVFDPGWLSYRGMRADDGDLMIPLEQGDQGSKGVGAQGSGRVRAHGGDVAIPLKRRGGSGLAAV